MSVDRYFISDKFPLYFINPTMINWLDVFIWPEDKYLLFFL